LGEHRDRVDRVAMVEYARETPNLGGGLMKSPLSRFLAAIAFSLGAAAPASAITGNYVKDFEHPLAGTLDRFATARGTQDITLTDSGYGLTYTNPQFTTSFRERLMATTIIPNLRSNLTDGFNLQAAGNPGNNRGARASGTRAVRCLSGARRRM
jgi:hypothetical protein